MVAKGVGNENTRKLMSGDDSNAGTGNAQKVSYKLMADTFNKDIKIPLDTIFKELGSFTPYGVKFWVKYVVTFPPLDEIMVAQSRQSVAAYELENIRFRFRKLVDIELYKNAVSAYSIKHKLPFHTITHHTSIEWEAASTEEKVSVNTPHNSLDAIVLLFTEKGADDLEKYVYPNTNSVEVTIEGVWNALYPGGSGSLIKNSMYRHTRAFFFNGVKNVVKPTESEEEVPQEVSKKPKKLLESPRRSKWKLSWVKLHKSVDFQNQMRTRIKMKVGPLSLTGSI